MKRVKSYNQFRESRPIKEEFIGKMLRKITGKNAKRIDLIKRYFSVLVYAVCPHRNVGVFLFAPNPA